MSRVTSAISKEAELRKTEVSGMVNTIYFGGGTPGILPDEILETIFDSLRKNFSISEQAEITLETNPDDVTFEKARFWKEMGVNRLSIGIQSFSDEYLKWMNRAHNATTAEACIRIAQKSGFDNLTIDLIYGLPNLSIQNWKKDIERIINLGVPHVSSYCLTVEPKTVLAHNIEKGKDKPVDDQAAAEQFKTLQEVLDKNGYHQYEVSNFSLPAMESKHNSAYWKGTPYVGLGPSAHGFTGSSRYSNIANNARYCAAIEQNELPQEVELLSKENRFNEWIMTRLRMTEGISLTQAKAEFDVNLQEDYQDVINRRISQGHLTLMEGRIRLTREGLFFADGIAAEFFILDHED